MASCPRINLLSSEEVSRIYEQTMGILSNKGVRVDHPKALDLLSKAGASVDFSSQQVRFSRDIIETALKTTPRNAMMAGSDESKDVALPHPDGLIYGCTCNQPTRYLDPDSNTYSDVTEAKVAEWAQLIELLDGIHIGGILTPMDVPQETADIHALKLLFENMSKPIMLLSYTLESVEYLFELMVVKAGGTDSLKNRPIVAISPTPFTPLAFKAMDMEEILQSCRFGVPILSNCLPILGGTAPFTIAGSVLVAAAEILAVLVMAQLLKPGIPIIGKPQINTLDMLTGRTFMGSVEVSLSNAATTQFIKDALGIPVIAPGLKTDSHLPDEQAMAETTVMALLVALSGADIIFMAGRMGSPSSVSFVQLILSDTLLSIVRRVMSGISVDEETLALKEIMDTPPGGHFIDRQHTLRHCRDALRPELFLNEALEAWSSKGSKDLRTRAKDRYRELKKAMRPQSLPDDIQRELNLIVKRADERLVK